MLFVFLCRDKPGSAALRQENRPAHLAFMESLGKDVVIYAGPLLDEAGTAAVGSLLILDCPDRAAAGALAARDPYARAGLFASVEILPTRKVLPRDPPVSLESR